MTIEIYSHDGDYEYERIARFEDGEWVEGQEEVDPTGYYEDGDPEAVEDVLRDDFNGPDIVAVDPSEMVEPEAEKNSQSIGPTQATLLGVGDDVTVVDTEGSDDEDEEEVDE